MAPLSRDTPSRTRIFLLCKHPSPYPLAIGSSMASTALFGSAGAFRQKVMVWMGDLLLPDFSLAAR